MIHALLVAGVVVGVIGLGVGYFIFGAILATAYDEQHRDMGSFPCFCLWPLVVVLAVVIAIGRAAWWAATAEG
jgi:hypothetical protein